jgi:hypothetical protein
MRRWLVAFNGDLLVATSPAGSINARYIIAEPTNPFIDCNYVTRVMVSNVGIRGVAISVVISPTISLIIQIMTTVDVGVGTGIEKIPEDSAFIAGLDCEPELRCIERCD